MSSAMNPSTTHEFEIKRGDTGPVLETVLIDGDGLPVDLTSAISVGLTMTLATNPRTPVLVNAACGFALTLRALCRTPGRRRTRRWSACTTSSGR